MPPKKSTRTPSKTPKKTALKSAGGGPRPEPNEDDTLALYRTCQEIAAWTIRKNYPHLENQANEDAYYRILAHEADKVFDHVTKKFPGMTHKDLNEFVKWSYEAGGWEMDNLAGELERVTLNKKQQEEKEPGEPIPEPPGPYPREMEEDK